MPGEKNYGVSNVFQPADSSKIAPAVRRTIGIGRDARRDLYGLTVAQSRPRNESNINKKIRLAIMLRPRHFVAILGPVLAGGLCAQTAFDSGYDCWIGNAAGLDTTHYVRCIADRDHLASSVPDGEFTLDRIHSLLHQSAVGEVERMVQSNPDLLRSGRVRSVALYSYPAEWSWADGMPQKLVSSAWCAAMGDCRISVFRR